MSAKRSQKGVAQQEAVVVFVIWSYWLQYCHSDSKHAREVNAKVGNRKEAFLCGESTGNVP
jgi:hypothetical protein